MTEKFCARPASPPVFKNDLQNTPTSVAGTFFSQTHPPLPSPALFMLPCATLESKALDPSLGRHPTAPPPHAPLETPTGYGYLLPREYPWSLRLDPVGVADQDCLGVPSPLFPFPVSLRVYIDFFPSLAVSLANPSSFIPPLEIFLPRASRVHSDPLNDKLLIPESVAGPTPVTPAFLGATRFF